MAPSNPGCREAACSDPKTKELYGFDAVLGGGVKLTGSERNDGVYDLAVHHNSGVSLFVVCSMCMPARMYHFNLEDYKRFLGGERVPAQTLSRKDLTLLREMYEVDEYQGDRTGDAQRVIQPIMQALKNDSKTATEVQASLERIEAGPLAYYSIIGRESVAALREEFKKREPDLQA